MNTSITITAHMCDMDGKNLLDLRHKGEIFMKMLTAIINADDANTVIGQLMQQRFQVTKLATTGGFLRAGNVTVLIGLQDDQLDAALSTIREHCHKRTQFVPTTAAFNAGMYHSLPVEVEVGGATVFVSNVERFEKY